MSSLHIIYASTSGHTEYVMLKLSEALQAKGVAVSALPAERAAPEDFSKANVILLASSTWNTGNVEGQLNPHMDALLRDRAKDVSLNGKKILIVALGDQRYRYKANAAVHMEEFTKSHGGTLPLPSFTMLNEPYGQESVIDTWIPSILNVLQ